MTPRILTPMETSLLDTVNQLQSEHQKDRERLTQEMADLRSMIHQLTSQQVWQTQILIGLQPLLGLALPPKD